MAGYGVRMEGLDEFAQAVRRGNERARPAFRAALQATGAAAEGHIKDHTPVQTGRLRASIRHFVRDLAAWVVTDVRYGGYVEFGTSRMSPRYYFKRGIDAAMPQLRTLWSDAMKSLWR